MAIVPLSRKQQKKKNELENGVWQKKLKQDLKNTKLVSSQERNGNLKINLQPRVGCHLKTL